MEPVEPGEEADEESCVKGEGRIGCMVAVSIIAPLAVVELGVLETLENGSSVEPDLALQGECLRRL